MLKGLHPYLNGELLKVLDDMGHADQLLLVDRNYPAFATGKPVVRLAATSIGEVFGAILSVFPLDHFVEEPIWRMEVSDDPDQITPTQELVLEMVRSAEGPGVRCGVVPRAEFYARASKVFAIVHTLEPAPYSCFILQKGVVFPEGVAANGQAI
jgi:L-fucose mutarotase